LIVNGDELCVRLLIADKGTGVADVVDELLEPPPPLPVVDELDEDEDEASADVGVVEASWLPAAEPTLEELSSVVAAVVVVELPEAEFVSVEPGVFDERPALFDGVSVDTVPLDEDDVRPDVLCAEELPPALPWM
jgi:hypothetical protein